MNKESLKNTYIAAQVMNMIDLFSTLFYIDYGGREGNPVVLAFMQYMGVVEGLVFVKLGAAGLIYFLYSKTSTEMKAVYGLQGVTAAYILLMGWHIFAWLMLLGIVT